MNQEYERYIGYIHAPHPKGGKESGTCFFVNANTAIAAAHTFDDTCEPYSLYIHGNEYRFGNSDLRLLDQCAIIELKDTPFESYDSKAVSYNLDFNLNCTTNITWEACGYAIENEEETKRYISGQLCSYCPDNYLCVLSQPEPRYPSYCGMSGSPVFINGLLVGILQREQCIQGVPENLYLSAAEEFRSVIPEDAICKYIYNNKFIPPKDYSIQYSTECLIKRTVISRSTQQISSLYDLVDNDSGNPCYIVLGEAGLGKTKELQRLAVECPSSLHPLYCSLKSLTAGQTLDDLEPELRLYIENGVPFCLILDGFDEIRDTSMRDDTFPALLEQLIKKIERSNVKRFCIIVGSRTAFYYGKKFDGFEEMSLTYLSKEDIDTVLAQGSVDKESFYTEIGEKSLYSFIQNPFYLKNIVALYQDDGGQLPSANNLMDSIINRLYEKQNAGRFNKTECRKARVLLRSISACFIMRTPDPIDNEQFYSMIETHVDETSLDLINKTGIVDADDSWNLTFKHNNYFEYLAAEFFNIKYKNDLDGLLSIIAYENRKGIFNNFKNMVTYLLLIRETPDLKEWIVKNCPDAIKVVENEKLTDEMSLARLTAIVEEDAQKGYYTTYDHEEDLSRYINNAKSISYLLGVIDSSSNELELLNAVRVLGELKNLHCMDNQIRDTLLRLLVSDRANKHHKRDALFAICDLNLSNEATTAFILKHFSDCTDTEILRGIDRYIYTNSEFDTFADILVKQYVMMETSDYLDFRVHDCLKQFKSVQSMIQLFDAITVKQDDITISKSSEIIKTLSGYNQVLCGMFKGRKAPGDLLQSIIRLSLFLASDCYLESNVFSGFLNSTKSDGIAINTYYSVFGIRGFSFYYLSKDLHCYADFLISKYEEGAFHNVELLSEFEFCVRGLDKNSDGRERCLASIKKKNDTAAEESIRRITRQDDYNERVDQNKKRTAELVFDYQEFVCVITHLVSQCENEDPDLIELRASMRHPYAYDSFEWCVVELLGRICNMKEKVREKISGYETKPTEWIVLSASSFIDKHKNYFNDEQITVISESATKILNNPEGCSVKLFRSAIKIVKNTNLALQKEILLHLLLIHPGYFNDNTQMGFPDFLIDRLSQEDIVGHIESKINNGLGVNDYSCSCVQYCEKIVYSSDNTISLAATLLNSDSYSCFLHAWNYLMSINKVDILIDSIVNGKAKKKYLISYVSLLAESSTPELDNVVSGWFNELRSLEKADITEDNLSEYREKYDYLEIDHSKDTVKEFRNGVLQAMRNLFHYMFYNNIDDFINLYLDEMIEKKTYCHYETRQFDCAAGSIRSIDYLGKLLTIYEMICDGSFIDTREASMVSNDFYNAITAIGKEHPTETLSIIKDQIGHDNIRYRRVMNLVYDQTYSIQYMSSDKEYTIHEIEQIVFVA